MPLFICRPGFIARKLCPELVFVKPDFSKYSKASHQVQEIFREYDQEMDAASLDEAYMDVTDYCKTKNLSGISITDHCHDAARSLGIEERCLQKASATVAAAAVRWQVNIICA